MLGTKLVTGDSQSSPEEGPFGAASGARADTGMAADSYGNRSKV